MRVAGTGMVLIGMTVLPLSLIALARGSVLSVTVASSSWVLAGIMLAGEGGLIIPKPVERWIAPVWCHIRGGVTRLGNMVFPSEGGD